MMTCLCIKYPPVLLYTRGEDKPDTVYPRAVPRRVSPVYRLSSPTRAARGGEHVRYPVRHAPTPFCFGCYIESTTVPRPSTNRNCVIHFENIQRSMEFCSHCKYMLVRRGIVCPARLDKFDSSPTTTAKEFIPVM